MNRCRISHSFLADIKQGLKKGGKNRKIRDFIEKWNLKLKDGHVFHNNRQVIPYSWREPQRLEALLKKEAEQNGMPLSREGAYAYMSKKYVGIKRRPIVAWLKRIEQLQLIHRRPDSKTRINDRTREGARNYRMATKFDGAYALGVDLFSIPSQWSAYKHFFVAVLQKSGFLWLEPMKNKSASLAKTMLARVFADCKKRFGSLPTAIITDDGNEFKSAFDQYIAKHKIKRHIAPHVSWVEKKNSTFARTFAVMRELYGFKKALSLTLLKVNNTKNRITRKAPVDWVADDFTKKMKRHNRKIALYPRRKRPRHFLVDDRVRHMLRATLGKTAFYKSYEGMRSKKHAMWTKKLFKIKQKRKVRGRFKYKVNESWWFPHELLLCEDDIITLTPSTELSLPVTKSKKVSKPKVKKAPRKPAANRVSAPMDPPMGVRRSSRLRKRGRIDYSGM